MDILKYGATPEEYGIASSDILAFLDDLDFRGMNMNSVMIIADGNVITEGYYPPFNKDRLQRMYSTSKTFASAAIGCLVTEGKVSLDDKVVKFFPEQKNVDPLVAEATVRELLTMSSPFVGCTYFDYSKNKHRENWTDSFFDTKPTRPAGTAFDYDTSASYILDVIVERITGKPYIDYLKDKFLRECGFSENSWCVKAPEGYSWGGSGVLCTTRDLGRFCQVFLNKGKINGKQVISEKYMEEATSRQVDNAAAGFTDLFHGNGYGYQIWITKVGYAFLGMGGQFAFFYPDKKLVLVCTGDNQGHPVGYISAAEAFKYKVIDKISDSPLAPSPEAHSALLDRLAALKKPILDGKAHVSGESEYLDKKYVLEPNSMGIEWFMLTSDGKFKYKNRGGEKEYSFGFGEYKETKFPEAHYYYDTITVPGNREFDAIAYAVWTEEKKLVLRTFITDIYLGNYTATFGFKDNRVGVKMLKTAEWFLNEYAGITWGTRED